MQGSRDVWERWMQDREDANTHMQYSDYRSWWMRAVVLACATPEEREAVIAELNRLESEQHSG